MDTIILLIANLKPPIATLDKRNQFCVVKLAPKEDIMSRHHAWVDTSAPKRPHSPCGNRGKG